MLRGSVITDILMRTTQNRVLFEKLIFAQLVKKYQIFHRIQISLQISQEPTNGPYPEPDIAIRTLVLFLRYIYTYLHCLRLGQPNVFFAQISSIKILHAFVISLIEIPKQ